MTKTNHTSGFIKVFRSVMDKAWYAKQDYFHLWMHLLLKANHSGKDVYFGGKLVKLNAGQFITGRLKLSQETGIEKSKIERILTVFKHEQQIEQRTDRQNRIITILSWNEYQSSEQRNEQRMNNERTTNEQRMNTDKNIKNEISKEEIKKDLEPDFEKKSGIESPLKIQKRKKINLSSDENYIKFISWFNEYVGKKLNKTCKYQPVNGKTYRQFNDLIGIYGDDFGNCAAQALSKALKDEWMVKNDYKWLTPEFFTRVDKFERYFNSK